MDINTNRVASTPRCHEYHLLQPSGAGGEGQVRESAQTNYISTERKDREVVLGRSRVVNGIEVEESEGVYRLMLPVL